MQFIDMPIKQKLMRVIILISGIVLIVTCLTFFAYEYYASKQRLIEQLSTQGEIISANSTAALAFDNPKDGKEILASLKADPHIVTACLYDKEGKIFAHYPDTLDSIAFPLNRETEGFRFANMHLEGFQEVKEGENRLGTLYMKSDLGAMYQRFRLYGIIAAFVVVISLLLAYLLSGVLQKSISSPILSLAETAKAISEKKDYSVRANKLGNDEVGSLTDALNQMLSQIQVQNEYLFDFNKKLEQKVAERTAELEKANSGLKKSEEQFKGLLESAPDAMVIVNKEGVIKLINAQTEKLFGYTKAELTGQKVEILIPQRFAGNHPHHRNNFFANPKVREMGAGLELFGKKKNGEEFSIEISLSPLHTLEGILVSAAIRDITLRKIAEAELREKSKELEHINKELEQFAYVASHDLQEPLRTVSNFVGLLDEKYAGKTDKETEQYFKFILNATARMRSLIKDLLDFSRVGKDITFAAFDCNELLKEVIAELDISINENAATINAAELPVLEGSRMAVKQLFQNLITNAIKFRKKNVAPELTITVEEKSAEYLFAFKDNGIGIDEQYKERIFVIFQRLHNTSEYPGTGIGLATCKKIVLLHNGKIWIESKLGEGSTFYFTISKNL